MDCLMRKKIKKRNRKKPKQNRPVCFFKAIYFAFPEQQHFFLEVFFLVVFVGVRVGLKKDWNKVNWNSWLSLDCQKSLWQHWRHVKVISRPILSSLTFCESHLLALASTKYRINCITCLYVWMSCTFREDDLLLSHYYCLQPGSNPVVNKHFSSHNSSSEHSFFYSLQMLEAAMISWSSKNSLSGTNNPAAFKATAISLIAFLMLLLAN